MNLFIERSEHFYIKPVIIIFPDIKRTPIFTFEIFAKRKKNKEHYISKIKMKVT